MISTSISVPSVATRTCTYFRMSFKDKVVIITGAGGGIGSATAVHFAQQGASLLLVDIDLDAVQKTSVLCGAQDQDPRIRFIKADLNEEKEVRNVIIAAEKIFGRIDVLINNAAISSRHDIFKDNFLEKYEETFNINLKAPMLLTHLAAPHLIASKGNVINLTSVGGIHPIPTLLMYNCSKAALRTFTKCAALELAPKSVRVNAIAPAAVKTNMVKLVGVTDVAEFEKKRAPLLPLKKMIESKEVAELIAYLASDKAASITGAEFVIDAGHLLGAEAPKYSND